MHLKIFALLLSLACLPVLGQSGQAPFIDAEPGKTPPALALQPGQDFSTGRREWKLSPLTPFSETMLQAPPTRRALLPLGDAKIDPDILRRPPKSILDAQSQGTLMAQNRFPGLRFLPIESPQGTSGPISTTWPKLKMERIPIEWPGAKVIPVYDPAMKQSPTRSDVLAQP